jgi:hypothetical protein
MPTTTQPVTAGQTHGLLVDERMADRMLREWPRSIWTIAISAISQMEGHI